MSTASAFHRHGRSSLVDILCLYARSRGGRRGSLQHHVARQQSRCCSRCLHLARNEPLARRTSFVHNNKTYAPSFRYFVDSTSTEDDVDEDDAGPPTRRRRIALKSGRARRKRVLKRKEEDAASSDDEADTAIHEHEATKEKGAADVDITYHPLKDYVRAEQEGNLFFGMPTNPLRERYILSLRKRKYPRTWSGWKAVWERAWEKYLWTFEGFLLPVKKRDSEGNVIPPGQEEEEGAEDDEEEQSIKDKATEAAKQISQNVQKNVSTIQEEAPKLLKFGQEVTGISTREELREWIGEQLKLGTECLSEFMKGYRKGRDDEVDRMLHEYFKDLDGDKDKPDGKTATAISQDVNEVTAKTSGDDTIDGGATETVKREKRTWGRRERRRLKRSGRSDTETTKE